ncbi:hypothetical protein [Saccharibacillus deserti]|uniref:hypothetical protein n=1 Tax=Saccharibacillus deserti TaxID=1634444 RepID=UPI001557379C|nr:hypothetical protein [Saccharibacillus deserti]
MVKWFLSGLALSALSLLVALLLKMPEILVFFTMMVGIFAVAVAVHLHVTLRWFYRYNQFRSNHEGADYREKHRLKYKLAAFALPNLAVGGIANEMYQLWAWM